MLKKRTICAALAVMLCTAGCGMNVYPETDGFFVNDMNTGTQKATGAAVTQGSAADYDYGYDDEADIDVLVEEETGLGDVYTRDFPEFGQLTAGVWSDNENWGFFSNLISSERLTFPAFGLDPTKRIAVTVKTKDGKPVPNAKVELVDEKDNVVWAGVSDYDGRVYLINKNGGNTVYIRAAGGEKTPVTIAESGSQGGSSVYSSQAELVLDGEGRKYSKADIMFIIDSTGSMYDEMTFLQSEFTEITNRIGDADTRYSVNFYRDEGDEYLTKCSGFSSDVKKVQDTINREEAAGGKGQIAAVAQALDETMNAADWSEDSVKLAFLIFDAPPYREAADSLAASVETAAKKGIRLIPVVGSGSDLDVETFGRAIAIETGGTYVFLTDDSGIGGSHEEPMIGEHEVKLLVDVITDIINEYRQ